MFNPLYYRSLSLHPRWMNAVSAWHEHLPFALFIMELLKPKIFVELGTHAGDSYCAFAQAVSELHLGAACYAVDTWEGDAHSGFYGPEVLFDLRAHHDLRYSGFSNLLQMTFDSALSYFSDGSVDLLHLDGYHTHEAFLHDFESWLPKMSEVGVMLFHDINVRERDFGVWKVWEEIRERYPHFEFAHGHGLGVLAAGKHFPKALRILTDAKDEDAVRIRAFFAERGREVEVEFHARQVKEDLQKQMRELEIRFDEQGRQLNDALVSFESARDERKLLTERVEEQEGELFRLREAEAWLQLVELRERELEKEVETLRKGVAEKEQFLHQSELLKGQLLVLDKQLAFEKSQVLLLQGSLKELRITFDAQGRDSRGFQRQLVETERSLSERNRKLEKLVGLYEEQKKSLREKEGEVGALMKVAEGKNAEVVELKKVVEGKDGEVEELRRGAEEREGRLRVLSAVNAEFEVVKKCFTYRFLVWHRGVTGFFFGWSGRFFRDARLGIGVLRREGLRAFFWQGWRYLRGKPLHQGGTPSVPGALTLNEQYQIFLQQHALNDADVRRIKKECGEFSYRPKISIITPVYNVDPKWLNKCIESVVGQYYSNWELCLHDDASTDPGTLECMRGWEGRDERIKISYGMKNLNISGASNEALKLVTGEFIGLLDHDDELTPDALYEVVKLLQEHRTADMIYSDEDKIGEDGMLMDPFFKPDWSPDLFYSVNYVCHFTVLRKSLGDRIGWFRSRYDGVQDYDLFLRYLGCKPHIYHIPKILYHWRAHRLSTSSDVSIKSYAHTAGISALREHIHIRYPGAAVVDGFGSTNYRVRFPYPKDSLVSIIIPFKDKAAVLQKCVESILNKTPQKNYEILLVDNNSTEKATFSYLNKLRSVKSIRILEFPIPFNFSRLNNLAVQHAKGDFFVFLNNDTEVLSSEWLEELVSHANRPEIGAVGALLFYPDGSIQHAGVVCGLGGVAGHAFRFFGASDPGYFALARLVRNCSAVTAACVAVQREKFQSIGGFDEVNLAVAFNDVDFCLRLLEKGYRNLYTPYASLYHHESLSRGQDHAPDKLSRFRRECDHMRSRWAHLLMRDPYYNQNLTLDREDFSLRIGS